MIKASIVFLHGWSGRANSWDSNISYFEKLGYEALALKMPGFDLPNPEKSWGIPEYTDFVYKEIIKRFPNKKIILVGHSFGGRISIYLAYKHPEKIEKLILTSSAGINLEPTILRNSLIKISNLVKQTELTLPFIKNLRYLLRLLIGSKGYRNTDETMKEVFKNVVNLDLRDKLCFIQCPTLIIWGEKDKVTPIKMAEILNKNIKRSKLAVIKNARHQPYSTNIEEWNKIAKKFI